MGPLEGHRALNGKEPHGNLREPKGRNADTGDRDVRRVLPGKQGCSSHHWGQSKGKKGVERTAIQNLLGKVDRVLC